MGQALHLHHRVLFAISFFLLALGQASAQFTVSLTGITPSTASPLSSIQVATNGFVGSVSPNSVSVTLTPQIGAPLAAIDASSEQVLVGGIFRAVFTIPPSTPSGVYTVSVAGQNTAAQSFTSNNPSNLTLTVVAPTLAGVTPNQGQTGQSLSVTITGNLTHFQAGVTQARFGAGISVGGGLQGDFGPVTVLNATTANANLSISAAASLGSRDISVQTAGESVALANGFTVTPAPFTVSLTGISPSQASPLSVVQLTASGFSGSVSSGQVSVTLTPSAGGGAIGPVGVSSAQVLPGSILRVSFVVPTGAAPGDYFPTITGQNTTGAAFTTANPSNLTFSIVDPAIVITPNQGQRSQSMAIAINGTFTHFSQGTTQASFGPGISVGGGPEGGLGLVTVTSPTTATANIVISGSAPLTARNVAVQSGSEVVTLTNGFTVTASSFTVTLTGVSPSTTSSQSTVQLTASGFAGSVNVGDVSVTLTPTIGGVALGPLPAASAQILPGNILRVSFTIPAGTAPGNYFPTISGQNSTGTSFSSLNPSNLILTVVSPAITVNPNQGQRGQSIPVTITGDFTHFQQGVTQANFGPGISVGGGPENGLGPVTIASATTATANLVISAGAPMTARNVVVQTGSEVVTLTNGFTVTSQGFTVTLTGVSPATTSPLSTVQLNASGFVGSVNAGSVAVTLTPIGGGPALGPIPAASSQVLPGDILRVSFVIPAGTSLGSYLPAISGQNAAGTSFTTANPSSLTLVVVAPAITINPNQGPAGQSLAVAITGNFTHFQQGTTQANFGPGVSVGGGPEGGLGLITVTSPTSATANILIAAGAATNTRDVVVQTASEVVTLSNGFTVIGAASISVNPPQGQQGATLSVTITGTNTSFAQGTTAVSFEPGITVNSVTVIGPTSLTADITIPNNTPLVARDVTVTTGAQVVTAANAFLVVAGPKSITATPASGSQGATMNVTIGGVNTNFSAASQVTFTGGIIVNATTLNTAQSLTASITIPAGESLGAHTLTVTTGSEVVSTTFSVIEAPARTLSVAPNQGQQGQTLSVTVTGQNTNFVQGVTSVGFGPGVTINSVAVSSSTSLTVNLSIPNNAALGARDVTATTSGEVVTAPGAFAIIPGTRSITVTPSSGQQGSTPNLTITGVNTNFAPASQVSFSQSGITVNSVSLNSATSLTASITIAADATVGLRDVTVSTASEVVTAAGAFSVNAASTARLVSVVPSTGQRGQSLAVTITGENTGFAQGSSIVSFGPGITVTSIAVASSTVLTAQITIANDAEIGARTVTVTTGSQMAALPSGFFVVGSGSTQPFTCVVNAGVPPLVRAEGLTELVGDLVIVCTGGQAGTTQQANVQLFLNTNITSRQIGSSDTEALLIVDELGALPGLSGGTPAVYRGQRTSGENAVVWPGVTVVAPGAGQRILRITNVRANAALLGASTTLIPNQITAFLSASPSQSLPLSSPQQTVAYIAPGLTFDLRNCAGTQTLTNVNFAQCVGANNSGSRNLISGATGDMQFAVRFQEGFQTAFRPQLTSGQIPSIPGTVYNSESGFVRSTSDLPYAIGGADHGTRLVARFQNVPAGVRLFVTTVPGAGSSSGVAAILVQTGPNGEGGTLPQSTTPFAVPSTATINCPGSSLAGVPAAEISVVNGTALAVWEITAANPAFLESAVFGVAVAYTPDIQNRAPAAGQVRVAGSFGPFYGIESAGRASATLPVPRFADQPVVANAFSIEACVTHLLFPFVTNRSGFDTGIAISNTSRDHFGSQSDRLQSGPCTIHYFGQTDNSGAPPAAQKTTSNIGAGETLTFIVSSGGNFGINATPGFQGYIFAQCEFQYAHGFAFITDGPVGAARVAEGYLALVLSTPVINRGGGAESLSQ